MGGTCSTNGNFEDQNMMGENGRECSISRNGMSSKSGHLEKVQKLNETRQEMNAKVQSGNGFHDYRDKNLDMDAIVEHYTPPEFPVVDCVTALDITRCRKSWAQITKLQENKNASSLLVELVDEFYHRLILRANKFKEIFSNVRERATVLTKVLTFMLSVNQLPEEVRAQKYAELGVLHRAMGIAHWMFSTYMSILIETVSWVLKKHASIEVMESWTRLCSYTLRSLLEATIILKDVRKTEYAANYKTSPAKAKAAPTESTKKKIKKQPSSSNLRLQRQSSLSKNRNIARESGSLKKAPITPSAIETNSVEIRSKLGLNDWDT